MQACCYNLVTCLGYYINFREFKKIFCEIFEKVICCWETANKSKLNVLIIIEKKNPTRFFYFKVLTKPVDVLNELVDIQGTYCLGQRHAKRMSL